MVPTTSFDAVYPQLQYMGAKVKAWCLLVDVVVSLSISLNPRLLR